MAHALMFEIKRATPDRPMWVYVRHDRTQTDWKLDVAETDAACTAALHSDFGIDFAKVQAWRAKMLCPKRYVAEAASGALQPRTA